MYGHPIFTEKSDVDRSEMAFPVPSLTGGTNHRNVPQRGRGHMSRYNNIRDIPSLINLDLNASLSYSPNDEASRNERRFPNPRPNPRQREKTDSATRNETNKYSKSRPPDRREKEVHSRSDFRNYHRPSTPGFQHKGAEYDADGSTVSTASHHSQYTRNRGPNARSRENPDSATRNETNNKYSKYSSQNRNEYWLRYEKEDRVTRPHFRNYDRRSNAKSQPHEAEYDSDASTVSTASQHSQDTRNERGDGGQNAKRRNSSRPQYGNRNREPNRQVSQQDYDSDASQASNASSRFPEARPPKQHKFAQNDGKKSNSAVQISSGNSSRPRYVGYKFLKELSEKKPNDIIFTIKNPNSGFTDILDAEEVQKNSEWLLLIFQIVHEVCTLQFRGSKHEVLFQICNSKLLHNVRYYLGEVIYEKDQRVKERLPVFMRNLVIFCKTVIDVLPTLAIEKEFQTLIKKTKKSINDLETEAGIHVDETLLRQLTTAEEIIEENIKSRERPAAGKKKERVNIYRLMQDFPPPENFRDLSLYPDSNDLFRPGFGFVRPNITKGAYADVEHYLDVQFRLLREDFIDPLRQGIKKYLANKATQPNRLKQRYESIRFCTVQLVGVEVLEKNNTTAYAVNFDPQQRMKHVKWEYSKRFMYGSLLLFTNDDFQTFFCGTVVDRNLAKLKNGLVLVSFPAEGFKFNEQMRTKSFLMAESDVFFEPYFLVMKALKEFNEDNFPMREYIVRGGRHSKYPQYLYSLEPCTYEVLNHVVDIFDDYSWPERHRLELDVYQYRALRSALTRDFAIIQGPPGTGKTFLGLKIVQILLANVRENPNAIKLPILIVCYTNHALDQFLEGILRYTKELVRIGAQSKSEELEPFNLRGRNNLITQRKNAKHVGPAMQRQREEIKNLVKAIGTLNEKKKMIEQRAGILEYLWIRPFLPTVYQESFADDKDFTRWIFGEDEAYNEEDPAMEVDDNDAAAKRPEEEGEASAQKDEEDEVLDLVEKHDLVDEDDVYMLDEKAKAQISDEIQYSISTEKVLQLYSEERAVYRRLKQAMESNNFDGDYSELYNQLNESRLKLGNIKRMYDALLRIMELRGKEVDERHIEAFARVVDPFTIPARIRSVLYWNCVDKLMSSVMDKIQRVEEEYRRKVEHYEELKQMEDLYILQNCQIVGMTTTCAARLRNVLKTLSSSIVIVEEAAEVLESHIITSLTEKTEHVILIGDHKQLRPSSAVYELSRNFDIDISLFERMINNEMDCPMLNVQHRMRPEISSLITPLIYPDLQNHESVFAYESVPGITKNLYFVEHTNFEQQVEDTTSRKNIHEADFLLELARYIYLQGYDPSRITILTTYIGQMFYLREQRKRQYPLLNDVKIIVVDRYQGEENDIILLSLVRSNAEAKIGFLKTENRVCVALSRAKHGFFMIGNMDNLSGGSETWSNIKETLQRQQAIGTHLTLHCKQHQVFTRVSKKEDFIKVSEGGCHNTCSILLECGHLCKKLCHVMDRNHEEYKCREPCPKNCVRGHMCPNYCFEECVRCPVPVKKQLPCSHEKVLPCYMDENEYNCTVSVEVILPLCRHKATKKCYEKLEEVKCPEKCMDRLECGHSCTRNCHKNNDPEHNQFLCKKRCERLNKNCSQNHVCEKLCHQDCGGCTIKVTFLLKCGHQSQLACSVDLSKVKCFEKCSLTCGKCLQKCKKRCYEDCDPCNNKVQKTIPYCSHNITVQCHELPSHNLCKEKCERKRKCGHNCDGPCATTCDLIACPEVVQIIGQKSTCGHDLWAPCSRQSEIYYMLNIPDEFRKHCKEPCLALLKCGDLCEGTCGECYQGRLHVSCRKDCGNTLICGHSCQSPCREICPPCTRPCEFQCKHSKCSKVCGYPCVKCQEPCEWKCKHLKCMKKCGEKCDRKPCEENCDKKLKCGHDCIGFCGEPCPPKCRVCDEEEVTNIVFGSEDEPGARFVLMEDCNHIVESEALDHYMSMKSEDGEIVVKCCPICKTPITKTLRFMNQVKETYEHILNVKKKLYGSEKPMEELRRELLNTVKEIPNDKFKKADFLQVVEMVQYYREFLGQKSKKRKSAANNISVAQSKVIKYFTEIITDIGSRLDEILQLGEGGESSSLSSNSSQARLKDVIDLIFRTVEAKSLKINPQQVEDSLREIGRFHRMVDFHCVLSSSLYENNKNDREVMTLKTSIETLLYGNFAYADYVDRKIGELFRDFQTRIKSPKPLSQEEKRMIHQAMAKSFHGGANSLGHWFTCTNGHYYCITECGGAMEKSNCPECKEVIGGEHHTYVPTAKLAPDMDGAERPAWSSGHDMRNFQL